MDLFQSTRRLLVRGLLDHVYVFAVVRACAPDFVASAFHFRLLVRGAFLRLHSSAIGSRVRAWPVYLYLHLYRFYLFNGPVTIFYMIGLFVLGLDNNMFYHFGILMTIMLLFYMVVFMIIFAHYFPFSSRPEHLFLTIKERYFRHTRELFTTYQQQSSSVITPLKRALHLVTLNVSSKKLKVWGSKINHKHFDKTTPEAIGAFSKACDVLSNHINILMAAEKKLMTNPLITQLRQQHRDSIIPLMAGALASHQATQELDSVFDQYSQDYQTFEDKLEDFF